MRDLKYDFAAIEPKWQKKWQETGVYQTENHSDKPKFYALVEFPYPSGQGLHVGHARPYTAMDVVARKRRMDGYNVLFPMGYDAFGLPTENYAIKNHIHPAKVTHDNIENFRRQLQMLGYSFDWSREVNTTDPSYYKWTQWIFLQLYKHGLAYKTTMPVNWCTSCKCVLANEEVVEGVCERCGSPVIRKEKSQWMLKITEYAQRLIDDLDGLDFIERVKTQQKNWIGRSTGAEVTFQATTGDAIVVYTTRPDTLFGATYMVLSPEHELVRKWLEGGALKNAAEVTAYQKAAASKSDLERTELNKEKTGVRLDGVRGVNPVNGREIPIFISDYVLSTYGTGAIMAVPAHDDRDWEFAKKFGCEIIEVVSGGEDVQKEAFTAKDDKNPWFAAIRCATAPDTAQVGQLFGPQITKGRGVSLSVTYAMTLQGGEERALTFYLTGSAQTAQQAQERLLEAGYSSAEAAEALLEAGYQLVTGEEAAGMGTVLDQGEGVLGLEFALDSGNAPLRCQLQLFPLKDRLVLGMLVCEQDGLSGGQSLYQALRQGLQLSD